MSTATHTLTDARAAWRTHAMLRAMSADYLLREQFATDPIQVYCDYVAPGREVGQKADAASQLIFSVFSSPHLRRWIGDYARRLGGRVPSRHVFAREFAGAVAASRDPLVALALVRGAAVGEGHFELQADFFRAVLAAMSAGIQRIGHGDEPRRHRHGDESGRPGYGAQPRRGQPGRAGRRGGCQRCAFRR